MSKRNIGLEILEGVKEIKAFKGGKKELKVVKNIHHDDQETYLQIAPADETHHEKANAHDRDGRWIRRR